MGLIFFIVICAMFLSSCSGGLHDMVKGNISEFREFVLAGQTDEVYTELMCGQREIEYIVDGYSHELIPFGVLTFKFVEDVVPADENVTFVLFVGTQKFSGLCEKSPFDGSFAYDIKTIIDKKQNVLVEVSVGDKKLSMKLNSVMIDWVIFGDEALEVFVNQYKQELKSLVKNGVFKGEVYVKIIGDYDGYFSGYLYYVNCIGQTGENMSILVSPKTGNILSSTSNMQTE